MDNELLVGVQNNTDGTKVVARGTRDGGQVMQSMHGQYYEAALRGNMYHASTVIAGKIVLVAAVILAAVLIFRTWEFADPSPMNSWSW